MGDDQSVISSGQVISPETVTSQSFTSAFRGYHPAEVRQFLKRVSDEMAASASREVELRRALQEALARAAHPEIDEATVTTVLGEHAARLIASARETAGSITAEAQKQAEAIVREGEARVARIREEADGLMARRVAEADASAASIRHAAETEAKATAERAHAEALAVIENAKRQGKDMVTEARDVRERMLGDLSRRRRSAQVQVERLLAARERLLTAYDVVRRTLDEATAELEAAEPEARAAAETAARRFDEAELPLRPEPRAELWPAARPEAEAQRSRTLVASAVAPAPPRQAASALIRRRDDVAPPPPPARPPLRPQTVAGAAAGRTPVPEPPPAPVSELDTGEVPVVTIDAPRAGVDELFARIRADHDDDVAPDEPEPEPAAEPAAEPVLDPVAAEHALQERDQLLDEVEAGLTRALKRVLQDEQNEVLDGLRRAGAAPSAAILPAADAHVAAYRDAAVPWLRQAALAGGRFTADANAAGDVHVPVEAEAGGLALELVEPLRERLARALGSTDADDPAVAGESIRATYRQWKVQQVEVAARHHAFAAFAAGAFAATPDGAALQWLVDDDGHCPDCDDNALAGPTPKGEAFPTGQIHPPAHPGCRCLLVPVST